MKKMLTALLIAALALMGMAALAKDIHPMDNAPDLNNVAYPAEFNRMEVADGIVKDVHIYTVDRYNKAEIARLAVGDKLYIEGKEVEITALEKEGDDCLLINGGHDKNGYTLQEYSPMPEYDDSDFLDCWMSVEENDYHTYTQYNLADYEMDPQVTFTDASDIDAKPVTVSGLEAVTKALTAGESPSLSELNTTVTLKDGRIVAIKLDYTP